ncbi:MAG: hypothetical protein AAB541_00750 [Patescibacteria group bacterium]
MPPNSNTSPPHKKSFVPALSKRIWLALGMAIVIAAATGTFYYWYVPNNQKSTKTSQVYNATYTKLDSFKLTGSNAGSGISFDKPVEFGQDSGSTSESNRVILSDYKKANETVAIGSIGASSVYLDTSILQEFVKIFNQVVTSPQDKQSQSAPESILLLISSNLDPRFAATLGQARALTTPNLKTNTWEFDFTAAPQQAKDKQALPNIRGKAVFAVSISTFYNFVVYATDDNWQNNQKIWQQVIDSIKIDQ